MLAAAERVATLLCRVIATIGLLILLAFALLSGVDGLMRQFAKQPIDLVRDLGGVTVAIATACCMPAGFLLRSHVSVRLLESAAGKRVGGFFDALAAVLAAGVMLLIANEFVKYTGKARIGGQATFLLHVRTWPYWAVVTGILWFAALAQVLVAVVTVSRVLAGKQDAQSADRPEEDFR